MVHCILVHQHNSVVKKMVSTELKIRQGKAIGRSTMMLRGAFRTNWKFSLKRHTDKDVLTSGGRKRSEFGYLKRSMDTLEKTN